MTLAATKSVRTSREGWQGAAPSDWTPTKVKHAFTVTLGKMLQPRPASDEDIEVPYLKAQHAQWERVVLDDLPTMWASQHDVHQLALEKGDLLVCEGGEVGRAAFLNATPPPDCIFQNALHRVRSAERGNTRFLQLCLRHAATQGWFDVLCNRATIAHFTVEKFRELTICLPPLAEQERIADYLDAETARMDTLVAEKERMLALLEEKRAALVSHAVTLGLNPKAPTKPSGLDWLGDIPAHWQVRRLKHLADVHGGLTLGKQYGSTELEEYPYLRVANVQDGHIDLSTVTSIMVPAREAALYRLQAGDVLMNEGGDEDKLGRGAIWDGQIDPCLHQNHVFCVRPFGVSSEWLDTWTAAAPAKHYFQSKAKRATNLASISATNIKEMPLLLPPPDEQAAILAHLAKERARTAELEKALRASIALLKERRAALIAAAVTGQLELANT